MSVALRDVVAVLEELYDPAWAREWDAVGLVAGHPDAVVRRVLLAVDPVAATAEEALARGAELLITHHPLFLRGTTSIAQTTPKGRLLSRLVRADVGLHVAHTNADVATPGVSDALATALGLHDVRPLQPDPADQLDKLVTFVPVAGLERLTDALAAAGAGGIGDYTRCAWSVPGTGTFRPGPGAHPAVGTVGQVEQVAEARLEMVLPRAARGSVVAALVAAHPYEQPAYDVVELALSPGPRGLGRVGELDSPEPLSAFVQRVASALPATTGGVRAAGDPARPVRTVAVCGGSGGDLVGAAAGASADVLVTADLRHHPVSEATEDDGPALVDAPHWATEWPWLPAAADALRERLPDTVTVEVSTLVTDPWTVHAHTGHPVSEVSH